VNIPTTDNCFKKQTLNLMNKYFKSNTFDSNGEQVPKIVQTILKPNFYIDAMISFNTLHGCEIKMLHL